MDCPSLSLSLFHLNLKVKLPTIPDFPTHGIGLDQYAAEHRCSMSTSSSSHLTEDSSFSLPATSSSSFPIGPPTNTAGAAGSPLSRPKTAHRRASSVTSSFGSSLRLNKFVRRLHDMLVTEKGGGIVEWRRGLLVLYSTTAFTKSILPKYFNTKNFKTFRRQLNYYGFVHVRSLSATGSTTTALWINQDLARDEANEDVAAVLKLHRVEPNDAGKTVEGRRKRKEKALHTVEEDIGLTSKTLQLDQIRTMAIRGEEFGTYSDDGIAAAATTTGTAGHITVAPSSATSSPRYISTTNLPRGSTVSTTSTSCDRSHQDRVGIPHEVQFPREQRSLSIISGTGSDDNNTSSSINVSNNAAAASMLLLLARSWSATPNHDDLYRHQTMCAHVKHGSTIHVYFTLSDVRLHCSYCVLRIVPVQQLTEKSEGLDYVG